MKFVDVILPLPIANTFTYTVPNEYENSIRIGMRVIVPFGKRKLYTAIVYMVHSTKPEIHEAKEVILLLDSEPILRRPQLKFWDWISKYYQCSLGDVYKAALPSGLKLESETSVRLNPNFERSEMLSEKEIKILHEVSQSSAVTISILNKKTCINDTLPTVKKLLEKGAVEITEELNNKFREKTEVYIKISEEFLNEDKLRTVFDNLSRATKQLDLLMHYINLSNCLTPRNFKEISKKELLYKSKSTPAILNALIEKKIIKNYTKIIDKSSSTEVSLSPVNTLNLHQTKAYNEIQNQFIQKNVVLLHGITSSGKTEIYIHLIEKAISQGKQVLYLVPEIALTTQLTSRLKSIFGRQLGVYHSKFSDAERVEIWNSMLQSKQYDIIIGVRSSIYLPFRQLGLVIIDEEHETSYKQFEPAPRYHARNAAIVLASMHDAKTLLGTATPAIETYHNAKIGKYGLVELFHRHEEIELPEIIVVDTKEAYRKKQMNYHFSPLLLKRIALTLEKKEQVILFQNRRGYAPYIECKNCAYVPQCKNCDVSLTVHKSFGTLTCHYCGYTEHIPSTCPSCKNQDSLDTKGFGTEKIEDEIKTLFPEAKVQRMDMDTTRSKKAFEKIISDFETQKVDILIGTQMISKGLDFAGVSLVGILNADNMLNFPDFRAHERGFQLMAQVSGRAGRRNKQGTVILQTSSPNHLIISQVIKNDYKGMFKSQCEERRLFKYPPFYRIIQIEMRHRDINLVKQASIQLAFDLKKIFENRILGPNVPVIGKINNLYIRQILLKLEMESSAEKVKEILNSVIQKIQSNNQYKSLWINLDVDPM